MQIQISWLLQKPTDLDLLCLQNRVQLGSAGQELTFFSHFTKKTAVVGTTFRGASNDLPHGEIEIFVRIRFLSRALMLIFSFV